VKQHFQQPIHPVYVAAPIPFQNARNTPFGTLPTVAVALQKHALAKRLYKATHIVTAQGQVQAVQVQRVTIPIEIFFKSQIPGRLHRVPHPAYRLHLPIVLFILVAIHGQDTLSDLGHAGLVQNAVSQVDGKALELVGDGEARGAHLQPLTTLEC